MEKNFTEQDSLRLINEMITQARDNIQKGAANYMIRAGYSVAIIAIANIILIHVLPNPNMAFWVWSLMFPYFIIEKILGRKSDKQTLVKTHIDKIIGNIWEAFAYSVAILLVIIFGMGYIFKVYYFVILITPTILILMGLAQYITAAASRFKPFYWGVIAFWCGALLCMITLIVYKSSEIQFIILAICMIIGFVIPGHILNSKAKENV